MMKRFLATAALPTILGVTLGFISLFLNLNLQIALATLLPGGVLGGQLEALRRARAADPRASIEAVARISAPLAASMGQMLDNASESLSSFIGESAILDRITNQFSELNGILARARARHLEIEATDATTILTEWALKANAAISGTALASFATGWRRSSRGEAFWVAQMRGISRGVRIRRLFIYDTITQELRNLVEEQAAAGVQRGAPRLWNADFRR